SNHFFSNNGDGTFTDRTESAGLAGPSDGWSSAAAFGDLDQDGFLDLFVVNYCAYDPEDPLPASIQPVWRGLDVFFGPAGLPGQADLLYRNQGDGTFRDISERAGLATHPKLYGLGLILLDLDRDQDLDLYVANDSVVNQLWRNDGKMPLVEIGAISGTATNENAEEQAGMGVDAADYDDDGFIDLFVTNFALDWNTLYISEGGMRFRDGTFEAGLSDSWRYMGWGTKFFDFDHDGHLDLGIANGHIYPQVDEHPRIGSSYRQPDQLLRNIGNGRFAPVADAAWNVEHNSRGLALIDYDNDGDLDVVLTHIDAPPSLLRNDVGNQRNWISIRLEGTNSNRDGIGARLELEIGGRTLTRIVNPYGSFQSQSTSAVHFGLGDAEYIDKLTVYWPSLRTFEYKDLQANRFYTIRERSGIAGIREPSKGAP
ncbi:MAG: CRTAC1 family protein, partial [Acidobacteriota bacterium]